MRQIGHTMATPDLEIQEALQLFHDLGFQGTEVICRTREECGDRHGPAAGEARVPSPEWSTREVQEVVCQARELGVPFVTVTQYVKAINSPDSAERTAAVGQIRGYMDFANALGARYVRVYGGADGFGEESWPLAVASLRDLATAAERQGLVLLVENHPGTLTVTGEATARLVRAVDSPAVRVLYDPANVLCHSREPWPETLAVQRDLIAYVHVKDFRMENGERLACPVGAGDVPWGAILADLSASGFDGNLSYEYEKKWNPEQLPPSRTGLRACLEHVRSCLS